MPLTHDDLDLAAKFQELARRWKERSGVFSSVARMAMLPEYQNIIGMGRPAVPFILRELSQSPNFWFWALRAITCEDPVPETARGNLEAMTKAWLEWGAKEKLLCE